MQSVKRQDFHYDIIYSDDSSKTGVGVRKDIKASVEDARRMKRTERVIVPPFRPLLPLYVPVSRRPFIDNPRVLIRIPIFRFNTMFPAALPTPALSSTSCFPASFSPPSSTLRPVIPPPPPSEGGLNGQTETFKLRAHIKRTNFARASARLFGTLLRRKLKFHP